MKRMRNAWICALLLAAVLMTAGCEAIGQAGQAVGGWIQGEETNPGTQDGASEPGQNPENRPGETQDGTPGEETAVSEGGSGAQGGAAAEPAPAPIPGGTDEEGSGLSVSLYRIAGTAMIFRIENESDVSYSSVQFAWLFRPQKNGVFADENGLPQMVNASGEVPAYGTVYELVAVPDYTVLHGDSKQENPDDVFYYNWLTEDDVLDLRIVGWDVSDTVLQDASDWVEQKADPDASSGRLATVWNRSDTPIRFQAVAIYGEEQGGFVECTDYLPPAGVIMEESGGERPRYDGAEGNARAIVYAAEYLSPACKDQMTAAEIAQQGDALYQPDAAAFETCQVLITRAYFERS